MRSLFIHTVPLLFAALALSSGCTTTIPLPDLGERYNRTAQYHGPDRNPVIVIPGILGSKLAALDNPNGSTPLREIRVWGAFEGGAADPGTPDGARLIALPMQEGKPLSELRDDVYTDGALDSIRLTLLGLPIELEAYAGILGTLGVGGYLDDQLGQSGEIDYGTDHYSCFQFDYDWRRDNVENAHKLMAFIKKNRTFVQENLAEDHGGAPEDYDVKFDIVAHSMGGLMTRYMLRYGDADLPPEGEKPRVTWAGADYVDRVVLVGTPNAGSIDALVQLVKGTKFSPFHSGYSATVLGTMPSIYQLLPRARHERVFQQRAGDTPPTPLAIDDLALWQEQGWGLLCPKSDAARAQLLPDVETPEARLTITRDHLAKCLSRANRFHLALDTPARLPDGLYLSLYAGDGIPTNDKALVNDAGRITQLLKAPGDGTVTRESAVMDERLGDAWSPHLVTPVDWSDINFLFTDHLGLTSDHVFADNILYLLLESPKRVTPSEAADVMPTATSQN